MYLDNTGFVEAAGNGHLNILKFLLTKGASVHEKDNWGKRHILFIYLEKVTTN